MYQKSILKDGLRTITIPLKNTNTITVLVLVGTGSKYETKEINGVSHFLEHLFFKGAKKRSDTLAIAEALDQIGGVYNAFTSKEHTGFWAKAESRHLDLVLDWVSDLFLSPQLREADIEKEKGVIIEEVNLYLDTPISYIGDLWEKLLYQGQPAGWLVIGEKENILNFNRKKVLDYFNNHYSALNTVVCVAGNIKKAEAEKKIKDYFKKINPENPLGKAAVIEKQEKPEILLYFKETDQTHFCLGARGYDLFHPKRYAQAILATILGGNMSSRLFISVRVKNSLAYYIHTLSEYNTDTGYLVTQAGVDHKNLEKSVQLILKEYQDFKNKKISARELQKAKDYLKGTFSLSLESSDFQASYYATQELLEGKIVTPKEKMARIDQVSINDIKEVAEDIFRPEKLNLAIIGPYEKKEEIEKLLII